MFSQNFRFTAQEQKSIVKTFAPGQSLGATLKNKKNGN
jgi:hypothetical protein